MGSHIHYIIQGYRQKRDDSALEDVATVDIVLDPAAIRPQKETRQSARSRERSDTMSKGPSSAEAWALARAADLIDKPFFRVANIIEHDDADAHGRRGGD